MQQVMQFHFEESRPFRVIDRNGVPWFVLADVCRELEMGNPSQEANGLDDDEKSTLTINEGGNIKGLGTFGAMPLIINESGLYSLILRSRKPAAKRFKKWVTGEVLPQIRKTGSYSVSNSTPAFIQRFNLNWDRLEPGYFSIISELTVRLHGRLEMAGLRMADRANDGKELRPDVSVGKLFPAWLEKRYPNQADNFLTYIHTTPEWEGPARQYPNSLLHVYIEFIDTVWIPERANEYFKTRDPAALQYLPKLLPPLRKAITAIRTSKYVKNSNTKTFPSKKKIEA